jgi:hypothetical protein
MEESYMTPPSAFVTHLRRSFLPQRRTAPAHVRGGSRFSATEEDALGAALDEITTALVSSAPTCRTVAESRGLFLQFG